MKFTVNVQPLKDALSYTVVRENISKFFEKSTVVELTVENECLKVNTQATSLVSEAVVRGCCDCQDIGRAIVDSTLFKSLVSSIDSVEVTLEFKETCVSVLSGKSTFDVPKLLSEEDDASLDKPVSCSAEDNSILNVDVWKSVQSNQLYAVASSMIRKAYTYVWMSSDKGVLTGDLDMSFFTHYPESDLPGTFLVKPTIVNMLASMPDGCEVVHVEDLTYQVRFDLDSFSFCAEFSLQHEGSEDIGEYDSEIILDMVEAKSDSNVKLLKSSLSSAVKKAQLFSSASKPYCTVTCSRKGMYVVTDNVDCMVCSDECEKEYSSKFMVSDLDMVVSHMPSDEVEVSPIVKQGEVFGLRFKCGSVTSLIGGVE